MKGGDVPDLNDTIEQLRQHRADALERATIATTEAERFAAALAALGVDELLDDTTAKAIVREVAAAPVATIRRPDPPRPPKAVAAKAARGTVDYAEVASVARQALLRGDPIRNAVADHFGIKGPAADMRIQKARQLGHEIPSARPSGMGPIEKRPFDPEQARNATAVATTPGEVTGAMPLGSPPKPAGSTAVLERPRTSLTGIAHLEALLDGSIDTGGVDGDD